MNFTIDNMIQMARFFEMLAMRAPGAYALIMAGQAEKLDWDALEGRSKEDLRREVDEQLGQA
jgi:hypothetical protein